MNADADLAALKEDQLLQAEHPDAYPDGLLRTVQPRLKEWRREAARRLVFGTGSAYGSGTNPRSACRGIQPGGIFGKRAISPANWTQG